MQTAKHVVEREIDVWRLGRRPRSRGLCLVIGNCQSPALRALLLESEEFTRRYKVARVPAVHQIQARAIPRLRKAVGVADVVVAHPVRSGYRGLEIGTSELRPHCSGTWLSTPTLYYEGHFPYQVYVHATGELGTPAPRTSYHDLRFVFCASQGWDVGRSLGWLQEYEPVRDAIRTIALASEERMREKDAETDIPMAERVLSLASHSRAFFTVNHPTNEVMRGVVDGVLTRLDLPLSRSPKAPEGLGHARAPIEATVAHALGLRLAPDTHWVFGGRPFRTASLLAEHLEWYRQNPEVVRIALQEHKGRMQQLGLTG